MCLGFFFIGIFLLLRLFNLTGTYLKKNKQEDWQFQNVTIQIAENRRE